MPSILQGTVTKAGVMAKTITVTIERRVEHPKYIKQLLRHTKKLAHDELQEAKIGDRVTITHTRPLSSSKHFYLSAIDSRPTDGMRSVTIQGGPPALSPAKTMREIRRREAAEAARREAAEGSTAVGAGNAAGGKASVPDTPLTGSLGTGILGSILGAGGADATSR